MLMSPQILFFCVAGAGSSIKIRGDIQTWPLKCAQPIHPKITPKQEGFAPGAHNKKNAPDSGPTLQLDVAETPPRTAPE